MQVDRKAVVTFSANCQWHVLLIEACAESSTVKSYVLFTDFTDLPMGKCVLIETTVQKVASDPQCFLRDTGFIIVNDGGGGFPISKHGKNMLSLWKRYVREMSCLNENVPVSEWRQYHLIFRTGREVQRKILPSISRSHLWKAANNSWIEILLVLFETNRWIVKGLHEVRFYWT